MSTSRLPLNRNVEPRHQQHLAADKNQHKREAVLEQVKSLCDVRRQKYRARSPMMAKMLEVKTMKGPVVTAKMAGILSTAKTRSLISIITKTRNIGVAQRTPLMRTKNFCP